MHRSRLLLTALVLSIMLFITGCAAAEQPTTTAAPVSSPSAQPEATAQPEAVTTAALPGATPAPLSLNAKGMPYLTFDDPAFPMTFSELKGKVIYLNFFTTWCYYCTVEMPELFKLHQTYGDDLQVVLIHVPSNDTEAAAIQYLKDNGFDSMRMVEDKDMSLTSFYQLEGFPLSVVIDKDGYLSTYQPGAMTYEQMESAVTTAGLETVNE